MHQSIRLYDALMHNTIWRQVIQDIASKGLSQHQIAKKVGVDQSTICRLADGSAPEPRYGVGVKLLRLRDSMGQSPEPIDHVANAHAAIRRVESVAVAEIKHVAGEILKEAEPWDGATDRRQEAAPWDGKTERRKLDAPVDRRVSAASVARADWLRTQAAAKDQDATGAGA